MKILIIEDEQALSESIFSYLKESGFMCEVTSRLLDALDRVAMYEYDCILLDLMLPDGDGFKY